MIKIIVERYRAAVFLAFSLVLTLSAAACAGQTGLSAETAAVPTATPTVVLSGRGVGDTLQVMFWEAPTTLNPHLSSAYKDWEPSRVTYEPLASFDPNGNLIPFLAAEIPSQENGGVAPDGKSVTWKLKQGVKWSDGDAFTAVDVLFTYTYVTNPEIASPSAATYDNVESVEVIDDYTVKVNFKEATPTWDVPFIGIQGMILPSHVFEAYNGANAREAPANLLPIGTGPYRVKSPGIRPQEVIFLGSELVETNKIIYEPNPHFREEDKPFFRRVEWRGGITAGEAARSVLKDGDIDYAVDLSSISTHELLGLEEEGKGQLVTVLGPGVERIALNRTDPNTESAEGERSSTDVPHPFFSDEKVRQAFAHAIDREAVAALYDVAGIATSNNLVTPPRYNSPNSFYSFDLEQAAALLDEAGWVDTNGDGTRDKNGDKMQVVFQAPEGQTSQQIQRIIREDLESIGIEVNLKITASSEMFSEDPATNPNDYRRFNADMLLYQESTFSPDPTQYMQNWTCDQVPQQANNWSAGLNIERWCNEAYNTLHQQVRAELDPDKRQEIFIQMNDILIEDVVMIPLVHRAWVSGANAEIEGINLTPWDNELWNVKDWRYRLP